MSLTIPLHTWVVLLALASTTPCARANRLAVEGGAGEAGVGGGGREARLWKDWETLQKEPVAGIRVELEDGDILKWKAVIDGPEGTPYEGGEFHLTLRFGEHYPFTPPEVLMSTKIFHSNFGVNGHVCADILGDQWSPALGVKSVLLTIQSLIAEPWPRDAMNWEPATLLLENKKTEHDEKVREWVAKYAMKK